MNTVHQEIKQVAHAALSTGKRQTLRGWNIYPINIRHRFGVSRWWKLTDRFDITVVEVQGLDTLVRLASKYVVNEAPTERNVNFNPNFWLTPNSNEVK